ncbi:hypothetical protein ACFY2J_40055 [Streptomyces collinus]|uniref:hypothetical protein n=1 Tax=Streptomyces collinus TaxID=42684 RepID=UPI0036820F61
MELLDPDECAQSMATVNAAVDEARCELCGQPACTHCEEHLPAPHAACEECGRQLLHVVSRTSARGATR